MNNSNHSFKLSNVRRPGEAVAFGSLKPGDVFRLPGESTDHVLYESHKNGFIYLVTINEGALPCEIELSTIVIFQYHIK